MRAVLAGAALGLLTACEERDRLTFPTPSDGIGPVTTIDRPTRPDTTVPAGSDFFVNGRTIDPDGVDTVYFLVAGGSQGFPPLIGGPEVDTVRFGVPITTLGNSGQSLVVQIYGVDVLGNAGDTSTRRIDVQ